MSLIGRFSLLFGVSGAAGVAALPSSRQASLQRGRLAVYSAPRRCEKGSGRAGDRAGSDTRGQRRRSGGSAKLP